MSSVRESRRSDIMQAALAEFCAKGIEAVSMSEIARRARIGKSTIYEYFPSKDQLIEDICEMVMARLLNEINAVFAGEKTFREKMICYYQLLEGVVKHLGAHFPMIFVSEPITEIVCSCVETFQSLLLQTFSAEIRSAQERGELDTELDSTTVAVMVTTQISPLLFKGMARTGTEGAAEKVADILLRGIAARPAPAGAEAAASQKQREEPCIQRNPSEKAIG